MSREEIYVAVSLLERGEIVAFPTETVYGLGAPLFFPESIEKIFSVKGRPQDNPLIAHVCNLSQCEAISRELPPLFFQLAKAFFPGPLTLIVKKGKGVPSIVSAHLDTIAIRMPNHPIALELIEMVATPLVAPSANLSTFPSSTALEHVLADFNGKIGAIIDGGPSFHGVESTVIDLVSFEEPTLLRYGALPKEEIERYLGKRLSVYTKGPKSSPGMKYRHYAPKATVHLFDTCDALLSHHVSQLTEGKRCLILGDCPNDPLFLPLELKTLYRDLRLADATGCDQVLIYLKKAPIGALKERIEKISHRFVQG